MQPTTNTASQPLTLKQGQVFHGTIKQLYPEQMAEIQVGGHRMIAKLEVPLKAGDAHFFQVTNMNPQPELKVVTGPMAQGTSPTQQMQQLLDTMNLPKSAEMQQVLSHFMKEQLPISKDLLLVAEQWMKTLPEGVTKENALQALQKMLELKMPFTNDVFNALMQGQKTTGMTTTLDAFAQLLAKDASLTPELRNSLLQQIQNLAKPFDAETGGLMLARAVQTLTTPTAPIADKLQMLNLLKEAAVVPQQANLQNAITSSFNTIAKGQIPTSVQQASQVIQTILSMTPENTQQLTEQLKGWIINQGLLTKQQKDQLLQLVNRFTELPQNKQTVEVFAKQMHEQLIKAFADNTANQLFIQDANRNSTKDHLLSLINSEETFQNKQDILFRNIINFGNDSKQPAIQNLLSQVEVQVQEAVDSKAMEQALKTVLKGLGISYEAALSSNAADTQAIAQQLKPQLLQLLQDTQAAAPLRESAEMLLARMNGMQLLSGENGHLHQLIMQVPLELFGKKMDATLQWNGRMKDDGKIDAAYARVLFYLQMDSMQETVIDMQVQNRIVSVIVYNDNKELNSVAEPLKLALKAGLTEKDYQLSGVVIKPFEKPTEKKAEQSSKQQAENQGGVDIRI